MSRILVTGLSEFRRALQFAKKYEPDMLKTMLLGIAEEVVDKARPRMRSQFTSGRSTGQLESTMHPKSTTRAAAVTLGTPKRTPYGGWWEFGGPKKNSRRPPNRMFLKQGRTIYPTVGEMRPEIQEKTELIITKMSEILEEY